MPITVDLTGQKFGRLTVIKRAASTNQYLSAFWDCVCDCGNNASVYIQHLRSGATQSCGCLRKESVSKAKTTHGMSRSREYNIWRMLVRRCHDESSEAYPDYGGRGIVVCERWRESFEAFYEDMGPSPSRKHTVERNDNDKGYELSNCRWATRQEQANNRRNNVFHFHKGVGKTLIAWCRDLNLNFNTMSSRLRRGWTFEEAMKAENK